MEPLTAEFYDRDTVAVARDLLGKHIVRILEDGTELICAITETEAYVGPIDKACHAYNYKRTERTKTLFAPPGTAYVYLIYGMYHCVNFVTEREGEPCAVLIRGAEPVKNGDIIANKRFGRKLAELSAYQRKNLLNGPGKLCQGLDITRAQNGVNLTERDSGLYVCDGPAPEHIKTGPRVGIDYAEEAVDFPWRFQAEK